MKRVLDSLIGLTFPFLGSLRPTQAGARPMTDSSMTVYTPHGVRV